MEFRNLFLSVPQLLFPVFFFVLCLVHLSIGFYISLCSLICILPLCLFSLFSYLPYCFLVKFVTLSFLFSYYPILSDSPLYSIVICFLSAILHLFRALYLIHFCYLISCWFCFFMLLLFGKDLMTHPVLYFFLSPFSFPLFSFCSFYDSLFASVSILPFFYSFLSSLLYASPVLTIGFFLHSDHLFF